MKTAIEALFQAMVTDGWACESDGMVDAPTGHFAWVTNNPQDWSMVADAFADTLALYGEPDLPEFVGSFLIVEDSQGFVHITRYPTETAVRADFLRLQADLSEWDESEGL